MTFEERKTVVSDQSPPTTGTMTRQVTEMRPSGGEVARRIVILIFGIVQILIGLRVLLLLLDAREANAIVRFVLDLSQLFVAPFDGILRVDALHAAGSILDVSAVVAFVGWTILELIVIWAVGVFRREPA